MNYKKVFGYGVLVWAVAYLVATVFVAYKATSTPWVDIVVAIAVAVASYFAGRSVAAHSAGAMLSYSFLWVIIGLVLNIILTVPFTGWGFFSSWYMWLSNALVLLVPLSTVRKTTV
ncbi:MAG: hypothetical protein C3F02_02315 [Parcubacteria group bacterium]|nr:MAG: hypothetical protein C3F02_02315 [Parcubacteria group bacterium]